MSGLAANHKSKAIVFANSYIFIKIAVSPASMKHLLLALALGMHDPVEVKNIPHNNILVEQTRFVVTHNQDQKTGILSLNSKGVYFYEKQNSGYGEAQFILPVKTRAEDRHWLGIGDFNNDGKEDIAYIVNHTLHVHKNVSSTSIPSFSKPDFVLGMPHDKTADPKSFVTKDKENGFVADMNNDGLLDIVINNATGCYMFQNKGNLFFDTTKGPTIEFSRHVGEWGLEPVAYDWNHDGKLDVMLGSSQGIFVSYGGFGKPVKVADAKTAPYTSEDLDNFINNLNAVTFPYVPQYTFDDTIILHSGIIDGKNVLVAGTLFGFFALSDKIERLRMLDKQGNFMDRLRLAGNDHPDFGVNEKIVYATKAGLFVARNVNGFYKQQMYGRVRDGGANDRVYILPVDYDGTPQDYAIGTSTLLQFFTGVEP